MRRPRTTLATCALALALGGCSLLDLPKDLKQATCTDDAFCADLNTSHPGTSCQRWYCVAGTSGSHCALGVYDDDHDGAPKMGCESGDTAADCDDTRADLRGAILTRARIGEPVLRDGTASLSFAQAPGASSSALAFHAGSGAAGPPTASIAADPTMHLASSDPLSVSIRREQYPAAAASVPVPAGASTDAIAIAALDTDTYAVAFEDLSDTSCARVVAGVMKQEAVMQVELLENIQRFGLPDEAGRTCPPPASLCTEATTRAGLPACNEATETCGTAVRCVPRCDATGLPDGCRESMTESYPTVCSGPPFENDMPPNHGECVHPTEFSEGDCSPGLPACNEATETCGTAVRCVPRCDATGLPDGCRESMTESYPTVCSGPPFENDLPPNHGECVPYPTEISEGDCSPGCSGDTACGFLAGACVPACSPACAAGEVCSNSTCIARRRPFASPSMSALRSATGKTSVLLVYLRGAESGRNACPASPTAVDAQLLTYPETGARFLLGSPALPTMIGVTTDDEPPAVLPVPDFGWLLAVADSDGITLRRVEAREATGQLTVSELGSVAGTNLGDVALALGPTVGSARRVAIAYRRGCGAEARVLVRIVSLDSGSLADLGTTAETTLDGSAGVETLPAPAYSSALRQWLVAYRKSGALLARRLSETGALAPAPVITIFEAAALANINDRPFAYAIGTTPAFGVLFAVAGSAAPGIYGARVGCAM